MAERYMAKSLVFSNGSLYVGLNEQALVSRVYFPYIGYELHTPDMTHRIGVWVDGRVSWIDDEQWSHKTRYPYGALVGHTVATNESIGIILEFEDFVDSEKNALLRNIHVINVRSEQRSIRVFLHQAFVINNSPRPDTVQYLPEDKAVLHYSGDRAFVIGGATDVGQVFDQHSIGLFGDGRDGTWRDAEDGVLGGNMVDCGQADSTIRFALTIGGLSSRRIHYWLAAGTSIHQTTLLHRELQRTNIVKRLESTTKWWRKWLAPGLKAAEGIEPRYRQTFMEQLMRVESQIGANGTIASQSLATESSMQLRDAAYTLWPLVRLGHTDEPLRFFTFCADSISRESVLFPSYLTDGSPTATNRPYDGKYPPLESDAVALVAFVFLQFYAVQKQASLLDEYYESLLVPLCNFLSEFTDQHGLVHPSYSMSEQSKATTYATALTYAALQAAADIADARSDQERSVTWRLASEDIQEAARRLLVEDMMLRESSDEPAPTIAALFGVFMYGLLDVEHPALERTVRSIEDKLRRQDGLFATSGVHDDIDMIGSLWMAQYYLEAGRKEEAMTMLEYISNHPELLDEASSWQRAEYSSTLLDTAARY